MPAVLALASACVLALAAYAGVVVLALAVGLLQALVVGLWVRLTPVTDPRGTRVVTGLAAVAADVSVLLAGTDPPAVDPLAPVLGVLPVAALVQQLVRRDGRAEVVASVCGTVALGVLVVLPAAVLAARENTPGVAVVACVVAAAAVVGAVPSGRLSGRWRPVGLGLALVLATAAGIAVNHVGGALGGVRGGVVAATSALLAVCAVVAAGYVVEGENREPAPSRGRRRRRRPRRVPEQKAFGAVLPLVVACPAAYLLGRLVVT